MLAICSTYFHVKLKDVVNRKSDAFFLLDLCDLNEYSKKWLSSNEDGHCFYKKLKI